MINVVRWVLEDLQRYFRLLTRDMHQFNLLFLKRLPSVFLVWVLLLLCSACTMMQLPAFPTPAEHPQARAEQYFINGEFESALLEYEQIYETALSAEDRNQALYGLACTQMMLARTDDQVIEAISNLQKWDADKGTASFTENRHLLVLALKQQSDLIQKKNQALKEREEKQISLIASQQLQIADMLTTVERLRKQIEELEAIDENVQEKRKPL